MTTKNFRPNLWGYQEVLKHLRQMLVHHHLPDDVTDQDILALVTIVRNKFGPNPDLWMPTVVAFCGPNDWTGPYQDPTRISIHYDSNRRITDIGAG